MTAIPLAAGDSRRLTEVHERMFIKEDGTVARTLRPVARLFDETVLVGVVPLALGLVEDLLGQGGPLGLADDLRERLETAEADLANATAAREEEVSRLRAQLDEAEATFHDLHDALQKTRLDAAEVAARKDVRMAEGLGVRARVSRRLVTHRGGALGAQGELAERLRLIEEEHKKELAKARAPAAAPVPHQQLPPFGDAGRMQEAGVMDSTPPGSIHAEGGVEDVARAKQGLDHAVAASTPVSDGRGEAPSRAVTGPSAVSGQGRPPLRSTFPSPQGEGMAMSISSDSMASHGPSPSASAVVSGASDLGRTVLQAASTASRQSAEMLSRVPLGKVQDRLRGIGRNLVDAATAARTATQAGLSSGLTQPGRQQPMSLLDAQRHSPLSSGEPPKGPHASQPWPPTSSSTWPPPR